MISICARPRRFVGDANAGLPVTDPACLQRALSADS
jgi:hypothetical protein